MSAPPAIVNPLYEYLMSMSCIRFKYFTLRNLLFGPAVGPSACFESLAKQDATILRSGKSTTGAHRALASASFLYYIEYVLQSLPQIPILKLRQKFLSQG
jgi:hypothetical protein